MKSRKFLKYSLIGLVSILVIAVIGFLAWTRIARYPAFPEAAALAQTAQTPQGWYVFQPAQPTDTGFIFYPGGLVDPAAYAPLMKSLADQGIMSVIVPMPLDLAVFGVNRANDVLAAYPEIDHWIIGGHSLGGSMAAQYVKDNPTNVEGLAFLAAYPAANVDLSQLPIDVASLYGTLDGVAGDVFDESLSRLPAGTPLVVIEGGNHAQYGNYGPQAGDGVATISREEQQQQTATAIGELANALK
ncbi:MAG: alpha/beta hydrolase [Chloroflexi bacterium]|nr:alpha/beta hydrolase [Chloroflexota bacterium]